MGKKNNTFQLNEGNAEMKHNLLTTPAITGHLLSKLFLSVDKALLMRTVWTHIENEHSLFESN